MDVQSNSTGIDGGLTHKSQSVNEFDESGPVTLDAIPKSIKELMSMSAQQIRAFIILLMNITMPSSVNDEGTDIIGEYKIYSIKKMKWQMTSKPNTETGEKIRMFSPLFKIQWLKHPGFDTWEPLQNLLPDTHGMLMKYLNYLVYKERAIRMKRKLPPIPVLSGNLLGRGSTSLTRIEMVPTETSGPHFDKLQTLFSNYEEKREYSDATGFIL